MDRTRHVLIFFSDTGGGHRAAAHALGDALTGLPDRSYRITYVDGFKACAPFPFNHVPATYYPLTTYTPRLWGFLFHLSNRPALLPLAAALDDFLLRPGCARVLGAAAPDLVVSVHPLINRPPCRALKTARPDVPFVTVVTDLFDAHGLWFSAPADLVVVPTQGAYERGRAWGFPASRLRVVGQPISARFASPPPADSSAALRARLGLRPDLFTVLLVGGGEGMGPLAATARALDASGLPLQLAIITGRNTALRQELERTPWRVAATVQGFVTDMPDWLRASDLVITKAGPGTIMETLAAGKPMILSGYLPGQEEGNVAFVEEIGVGVLRTTPAAITAQVREWLQNGHQALAQFEQNARAASRPTAAIDIARLLDALVR